MRLLQLLLSSPFTTKGSFSNPKPRKDDFADRMAALDQGLCRRTLTGVMRPKWSIIVRL